MELLDWQGFKNRVEDVRKMVQQVDFNENGTMESQMITLFYKSW